MKKIFVAILFIIVTVAIIWAFWSRPQIQSIPASTPAPIQPSKELDKPSIKIEKAPEYSFPLTDYFSRIKIRKFGQYFGPNDPKPAMACGRVFVGFHDGDDLEILPGEEDSDVPVKAVAAGKIAQVGRVGGYGGLLVESASLAGEPVTIYYGHIDLGSVSKKTGEDVKAGEQIAILGDGCSAETDGERKHLHFAIKKGTDIDVRGYAPTDKALASWVNPKEMLESLNAMNP